MKLTTRVSTFFLSTLALVLVAYSLVFYWLSREQINYEFEHKLMGALNSLVAAVEVEATEVKWQPLEHMIATGSADLAESLHWAIVGNQNLIVEKSANVSEAFLTHAKEIARADASGKQSLAELSTAKDEMYLSQRLVAPQPDPSSHEPDEFDEIEVVVGQSTIERDRLLWRLLWFSLLVPTIAWLAVAALGRWMVRQALRPVLSMATQASSIQGADFKTRLAVPDSRDEISDLGRSFNRLLDRQQIAFNQQSRFAGDAAHELRTPLTILLGNIDVALRRKRTPDEYSTNLELLRKETSNLQGIVESLLFLARTDADAMLPQMEEVPLAAWLNDYWARWTGDNRHDDLSINNAISPEIRVRISPSLMARVLDNLISNALKYSQPNTPVRLAAEPHGNEVSISVVDSGRGIAAEDVGSIFDPFFRTKDAREAGIAGNGLGLAIASRIATAMGGRLECESKLGTGSRFTLFLPKL